MLQEMSLAMATGQARSADGRSGTGLAVRKWRDARIRGQVGQALSILTRRSRHLLDLSSTHNTGSLRGGRYAGLRTVRISHIRGSEGRSEDFDQDFCPLRSHNEARWLGIAAARLRGVVLPPVDLIQVGDIYYVRDGHHRISVARAFGQEEIDAEVTVWDVAHPLRSNTAGAPRRTPTAKRELAHRPA